MTPNNKPLPEEPKCDCGLNPHAIYCAKNQPLEHSKYSSKQGKYRSAVAIGGIHHGDGWDNPSMRQKLKLEAAPKPQDRRSDNGN